MSFPKKKQTILLFSVCLIFICSQFTFAGGVEWLPITPAELSMTKPTVEADADAEAIFWNVTLDDSRDSKMTYFHYVRVKIFTERGREKFSKFDIPFLNKRVKIQNIAARVIKPDGTITDLPQSDIFEREIIKAGKVKVRAKSFAVPGIEPGVIVEYQYEESRKGDSAGNETLIFQRDIPMQSVTYKLRPFENMTITPRFYNMPEMRFEKDKSDKKFFVATLKNVPAIKDEPYMPPEDEVRKWAYLTNGSGDNWIGINRGFGRAFLEWTKPNKQIKQKAEELTAGASSEDEKLRRLYAFVQNNIRNTAYDGALTEDEKDNLKLKDADDVLKRGMAPPMFIDILFASLARAANFDVNLVMAGDRSEQFFNPNKYPSSFINPTSISVKVGGDWKFFNPGAPFVPYSKLIWYEENVPSMLVGEAGYIWKTTSLSDQEESKTKRTGKFILTEDGTLEGTVTVEYNGHTAISRRQDAYTDSESKIEEDYKSEIKRKISTAEISNLTIENLKDNTKSLVYKYKLRVPNYAQKAGSRMFFQPGVFEYGVNPVFSASERLYPIYFSYPWSEQDKIEIKMPEGFSLDSGETPAEVKEPSNIGSLIIGIGIEKNTNTLVYDRKFHFGGGGNIYFQKETYQPLKNLFDAFHKSDSHTLALKKQ